MAMLVRTPPAPAPSGPITYTPSFSTDFDEYTANESLIDQAGWDSAGIISGFDMNLTDVGGGDIQVAGGSNTNSRANRTTAVTPRGEVYVKGTVEALPTSGARAGISYHGATGSGLANIFYIQNVSGVPTMFYGTISGSTSSTTPTITGVNGIGTGVTLASLGVSTSAPWDLEARAATTNSVMLFINGQLVGHHLTNQSGDMCGILEHDTSSRFSYFECGTYADSTTYGITYVGAGTTGTTVITAPAGVQDGDILIACNGRNGSTAPAAFTWPADWFAVTPRATAGSSSTFHSNEIRWFEWNTGDPTTWTMASGTPTMSICVGYRGVDVLSPILGATVFATGTSAVTTTAALVNTDPLAWRVQERALSNVTASTWSGMSTSVKGAQTIRTSRAGGGTGPTNIALGDSNGAVTAVSETASATKSGNSLGTTGMQFLLRPKRNP